MTIDDIKIGEYLKDCVYKDILTLITNKTNTSVELLITKKTLKDANMNEYLKYYNNELSKAMKNGTAKGIDHKQWFTIDEINKRFKL